MEFQFTFYIYLLILSGGVTGFLGVYAWQYRNVQKGVLNFSLLMLSGSWWSLTYSLQILEATFSRQFFWYRLSYIGIVLVPVFWFVFAYQYMDVSLLKNKKLLRGLYLIPAISQILIWFSDPPSFFWKEINFIENNGLKLITVEYGPFFWVHLFQSYGLLFFGVFILILGLIRDPKRYSGQIPGLLIGAITPWVGNILSISRLIDIGSLDITPVLFMVTGIGFGWSIFNSKLFTVVYLAHDTIVQGLKNAVFVVDTNGAVVDANQAAIKMTQKPLFEIMGQEYNSLFKDWPNMVPIYPGMLQEISNLSAYNLRTKKTYRISTSAIHGQNNRVSGKIIEFEDISREVASDSALKRTQASFYSILETVEDPYFETDIKGTLTYANPALCSAVKIKQNDIIGKNFRHIVAQSDVRMVFREFINMYETGEGLSSFQYQYKTSSGEIREGELSASLVHWGEGNVVGARGFIRDVTERLQSEREVRAAKDSAERRAEELAAINRVSEKVNSSLDLDEMLTSVCVELLVIFRARNVGITAYDKAANYVKIIAFQSALPDEPDALGLEIPLENNKATRSVLETKQPIVIKNAQVDSIALATQAISLERGTKSILIVPLLARGEAIGTIGMPALDPDRIYTESEARLALMIAHQIASAIENARMHSKTEKALGVAAKDLEIGREIQQGFFPETYPKLASWEVSSYFEPAREVAGDFYDVFPLNNGDMAVVIADVCDKGVGAALFMVLIRSLMRAYAEMQPITATSDEMLLSIIQQTNDYIATTHGKSNMFATVFFGILSSERNALCYINGGHEPPVVVDKYGKEKSFLMPTGPAVGLMPGLEFKVGTINFDAGDILLGYTDGVTDAQNAQGEFFTEEALINLAKHPYVSSYSLLFNISDTLNRHIQDHAQFDDITLIAVQREPEDENGHSFSAPAILENLSVLRSFIQGVSKHLHLEEDMVFSFQLALDEACTNIIEYGYEGQSDGKITLTVKQTSGSVTLEILDQGRAFSPKLAKQPDIDAALEERPVGGLGIFFIEQMMDDVDYFSDDSGNHLVLTKRIQ